MLTGIQCPLVRDLCRAVARGESVDPDDGDDDDPLHAGACAELLEVPGRRGEELGGRLLLGRRPGGGVDDALDACEGLGQALRRNDVDAVGARDRDDVVPGGLEHVDDLASDSPRRPRDGNLPACVHDSPPSRGGACHIGWVFVLSVL
jgi:hypothetical protein